MCKIDVAESWGTYAEQFISKRVISRKDRKCSECRGKILKGEMYESVTGRWDGCKDRYMICRLCLEIRKEFADSWCYGMLWEDIQEECSEDIEIGQIDNLSKEAVSHLENMMGWRWEED